MGLILRPLVPITLAGIMYFVLIAWLAEKTFFEIGKEIPTSAFIWFANSSTILMFFSGESLIPRPKPTTAL
jgi:hypothetical protein